jgi:hypothetical protein
MQATALALLSHADSITVCGMSMCSGPMTTMTMPQH